MPFHIPPGERGRGQGRERWGGIVFLVRPFELPLRSVYRSQKSYLSQALEDTMEVWQTISFPEPGREEDDEDSLGT
jgi:hypothetical protein